MESESRKNGNLENEEMKSQNRVGRKREWQTRDEFRLSDILHAIRKHVLFIVICAIAGLIVGIALSVVSFLRGEMSKQYAITTAIAVTSQNENGLFTAQSNNPNSTDIYLAEEMVDSVIFVLKSDRTLNAAVDRLELLGVSSKDIYNNLEMSQYNDTQVIQITLHWRSAQEGVEILNAINEVAPDILIETLKIGNVSVINYPTSKYIIGGSINAKLWVYLMILGLAIGIVISVIRQLIHPTLLSAADMEKMFAVEVLAEIPDRKQYFRKKRNLLIASEDDDDNFEVFDNYNSLAHILKNKISELSNHYIGCPK